MPGVLPVILVVSCLSLFNNLGHSELGQAFNGRENIMSNNNKAGIYFSYGRLDE